VRTLGYVRSQQDELLDDGSDEHETDIAERDMNQTVVVTAIRSRLNHSEPDVEWVSIPWHDAGKSRLRCSGDRGTDVAIQVERGTFLRHGDVLEHAGGRTLAVERTEEEVVCVRPRTLAEAATVGHAFGNQHVPIDAREDEIIIPVTTTLEIARGVLDTLGAVYEVAVRRPFAEAPPMKGHRH
jgi:urease accessory protein